MQPKDRRLVTENNLEAHTEAALEPVHAEIANAVTRVAHVETMAGLAPGDVTDAQTANLIQRSDSVTREAFGQAIAAEITTPDSAGRVALNTAIAESTPPAFVVSEDPNTPIGAGQVLFVVDRPFSPNRLDLAWWFDADAITGTGDGFDLPQWNDLSGYARHAVQGDAPSVPTYTTSGLNERPSVAFDGDSYLVHEDFTESVSGPITIFLVGQVNNPAVGNTFVDAHGPSNRSALATLSGDWWVNRGAGLLGGPADTAPHVFTVISWTDDLRLRVDGSQQAQRSSSMTSIRDVVLGASHDRRNPLDGYIAEAFMARGELSQDQIQAAEAYLAEKWGL